MLSFASLPSRTIMEIVRFGGLWCNRGVLRGEKPVPNRCCPHPPDSLEKAE
jgi:hypothetical protein